MLNIILLLVLLGLNVWDIKTTITFLSNGKGRELNPIAKTLMFRFGITKGLIILKTGAIIVPFTLLVALYPASLVVTGLLVASCIGYALVVRNNIKVGS
jgi:hypothetical protein